MKTERAGNENVCGPVPPSVFTFLSFSRPSALYSPPALPSVSTLTLLVFHIPSSQHSQCSLLVSPATIRFSGACSSHFFAAPSRISTDSSPTVPFGLCSPFVACCMVEHVCLFLFFLTLLPPLPCHFLQNLNVYFLLFLNISPGY